MNNQSLQVIILTKSIFLQHVTQILLFNIGIVLVPDQIYYKRQGMLQTLLPKSTATTKAIMEGQLFKDNFESSNNIVILCMDHGKGKLQTYLWL